MAGVMVALLGGGMLEAAGGAAAVKKIDGDDSAAIEQKFTQISKGAAGSVVAICAVTVPIESEDAMHSDRLTPDKLRVLLRDATRHVGTGFLIDADGYILTSEHVVSGAEQIWVTCDDRRVFPAIVLGTDPRQDLAVLKVPARKLQAVQFAPQGTLRRGQWAIALGNPWGLAGEGEMSMSVGIVSATDRSLPDLARSEGRIYAGLIQTTAQINPGNSGGPLLDIEGRVLGINTAVVLPYGGTNGIGFAMPWTPGLMEIVQSLKEGREVVYPFLGASLGAQTLAQRAMAGLKEGGAVVESVEPARRRRWLV